MNKSFSFISVYCIVLMSCTQNVSTIFTIDGKFEGGEVEFVVLSYEDLDEELVVDTVQLIKNKFFLTGKINGVSQVALTENASSDLISDSKNLFFFIEPTKNYITIRRNQRKAPKIVGSETQIEHENLNKITDPIYQKISELALEREELMKENLESKNERIEQITFEWKKNLKDIKDIRLKFVKENNNSYLSAYWITFYSGSLPLDSLNFYYNNLDLKVKRSLYGEKVLKTIELMSRDANSDPGDRAFNFELINEKDKIISLESFKGKYVLLDFWASWCAPCRKENPGLKKLYNKYHPKGLEVIGLSYDRDKEKWNQAIQDDSLEIWSHVFIGKHAELISVEYNIKTIPAYILIDREGYIVERYLDTASDNKNLSDLEKKLEEIF